MCQQTAALHTLAVAAKCEQSGVFHAPQQLQLQPFNACCGTAHLSQAVQHLTAVLPSLGAQRPNRAHLIDELLRSMVALIAYTVYSMLRWPAWHVTSGTDTSAYAALLVLSFRQHVNRVLTNTGQLKSELIRCLIAEFMGTLLFQIFGGAAPPKDTTAPAANGFALVCISE